MHKQVSTQVLAVMAVVLLLSSPHLTTGEDAVLKLDLKLDGEIRSLRFTPRDGLVQAAERFEHEQLRGVEVELLKYRDTGTDTALAQRYSGKKAMTPTWTEDYIKTLCCFCFWATFCSHEHCVFFV